MIAEYNGTGTLQRKYVYGPGIDEPIRIAPNLNGLKFYYHADGLGSITEMTDSGGAVVESYTYDVYGTPTMYDSGGFIDEFGISALANRFLFTGREWDRNTRLYNYRYRWYSPSLGRFVQVDPIGITWKGLNLYRYTDDNPVTWIDENGLAKKKPKLPKWPKKPKPPKPPKPGEPPEPPDIEGPPSLEGLSEECAKQAESDYKDLWNCTVANDPYETCIFLCNCLFEEFGSGYVAGCAKKCKDSYYERCCK